MLSEKFSVRLSIPDDDLRMNFFAHCLSIIKQRLSSIFSKFLSFDTLPPSFCAIIWQGITQCFSNATFYYIVVLSSLQEKDHSSSPLPTPVLVENQITSLAEAAANLAKDLPFFDAKPLNLKKPINREIMVRKTFFFCMYLPFPHQSCFWDLIFH